MVFIAFMKTSYRFLLYNIRYATGTGWKFHTPLPFSGYLKKTVRNLPGIIEFIKSHEPDIIGLIEVDGGSRRSEGISQALRMANDLGHEFMFESKYRKSLLNRHLPILRKQGNALLTNGGMIRGQCHYFEQGVKRLIMEVEFDNVIVFIVHLSVRRKRRQQQLDHLGHLVNSCRKPVVVGGDFNIFYGTGELEKFLADTRLQNANTRDILTFPSRNPRWQLDFILHSPRITVNRIHIPQVRLSDHLPLVCDFSLAG